MEILGLEPKTSMSKIVVLPIRLYPLNIHQILRYLYNIYKIYKFNPAGIRTLVITVKEL